MKLWIVIYFAGKVAGVVGPLPYDMVECRGRLANLESHATKPLSSIGGDIKCELLDQKPVIEPPYADAPR